MSADSPPDPDITGSEPPRTPTPADLAASLPRDAASSIDTPPAAVTMSVADPSPNDASGADREAERGLRNLLGAGSSQVTPSIAARARDIARPTDEDIAAAEENLTIVRRHWVPREPFRPGGRR